MSGRCPNPVEGRLNITGMKPNIIVKVLLWRLGLDTENFLDRIKTAEYRMMIEI
jgi:hypothetical protein